MIKYNNRIVYYINVGNFKRYYYFIIELCLCGVALALYYNTQRYGTGRVHTVQFMNTLLCCILYEYVLKLTQKTGVVGIVLPY